MNASRSDQADLILRDFARRLARSHHRQVFAAFAVATFFAGLVAISWNLPDLSALILSLGLLFYGWHLAERLLPISVSTRARWEREKQIAKEHPAYPHRNFLWFGIGSLVSALWQHRHDPFDLEKYRLPGILIVLGSVCYLCCIRYVREEQKRNA